MNIALATNLSEKFKKLLNIAIKIIVKELKLSSKIGKILVILLKN